MPFCKNPFPGIKLVFGPLARNITRPEFNKGPRHCQPVSNKTVRLKFHTQSGRDTQFARKATALAIKRHFSLSRFWDNLIFVIWTHTVIHTFSRPMTAETHSHYSWLADSWTLRLAGWQSGMLRLRILQDDHTWKIWQMAEPTASDWLTDWNTAEWSDN